jgi:hypothetical protein
MSPRDLVTRVEEICETGEKVLFRVLISGGFAYEVVRFVLWLLRRG